MQWVFAHAVRTTDLSLGRSPWCRWARGTTQRSCSSAVSRHEGGSWGWGRVNHALELGTVLFMGQGQHSPNVLWEARANTVMVDAMRERRRGKLPGPLPRALCLKHCNGWGCWVYVGHWWVLSCSIVLCRCKHSQWGTCGTFTPK